MKKILIALKSRLFNKIKTLQNDDFIKRIRSLVVGEGMLHSGNIYMLDHVLKNLPDNGSVVEIGSYGGLSTNLIVYLLRKHRKHNPFYSCDPWVYEGYHDSKGQAENFIDGRNDISRIEFSNYIRSSFITSTQFLSKENLPQSIHLRSDEFFEKWNKKESVTDVFKRTAKLGGEICFAYIDGDHSMEAVTKDFENVSKFLTKGGYILFDDSADEMQFGSAAFVQSLKKNKDYEIVMKNPNYLFRKK